MATPSFMSSDVPGEIIMLNGANPTITYQLVAVEKHGIAVFDPRVDESSICSAEPSYYGFTLEQRDRMVRLNEGLIRQQNELYEIFMDRINSSAEGIQNILDVKDGDLASHYLSNEEELSLAFSQLVKPLADYASAEFSAFCEAVAPVSPKTSGPKMGPG